MFPSVSLVCIPLLFSISILVSAQTACNGNAAYCSRQWSNITQIGAHDSAFVGTLPTDNQGVSLTGQLNAGIRFLQAQSHVNPFGTLSLCHTSCYELDAGSVESYLSTVKTWLDANPNEVLTLLLTNGDNVDVSEFDTAFTSSDIKKYAYIPPGSPAILAINAWPTLQELITANTRLVMFLDYGAQPSKYPYILDEFSYFFETPFDTTDPTFPQCTLDRPAGASPNGRMYIVNHFLDISIFGIDVPDTAADETTNAATGSGSIGAQTSLCQGMYGRGAKGVLVDNYDKGNVFVAQNNLNGL